nr:polymer-forming cytoskeletal protein [uncultured Oscillibacter sp.]
MGLFGGQTRVPDQMEEQYAAEEQEEMAQLPEPHTNTVIAKDLTVSGTLRGDGVVQIEGRVEGEVSLKGYVIVSATGVIKGPIEADVIRIAGSVEGSIIAHDHLRLEKTGSVVGDVTTVSFVIEDGGRLNGRTTMVREEKPAPRAGQDIRPGTGGLEEQPQ